MDHFYIPTKDTDDWRKLLADPDRQWRDGFSAQMLAASWQGAGGFPAEVKASFRASAIPLLQELEFIAGFPEHKVALPGGGASSQPDIMVVARSGGELVVVAVEGKVEEGFRELVSAWRQSASEGKAKRLRFLTERLSLGSKGSDALDKVHYQLLHRAASALLTAERLSARHAVMLVHSFSSKQKSFDDYAAFLELFDLTAKDGSVQSAGKRGKGSDTELYFSWTVGA